MPEIYAFNSLAAIGDLHPKSSLNKAKHQNNAQNEETQSCQYKK